jgi:alkylation response protein AidB-like acyl-CoA dehydrogenase
MLDSFPWWTEEHKAFSTDIQQFVNEMIPRSDEAKWKREFPHDIFESIGKKGYTGAMISREYGGLGLGLTGACIAGEEICRMPNLGRVFIGNMLGGTGQILAFGTEEQKKVFLPRIARGELGAICITEPFAGTDAAAMETTAFRNNNSYIINGKKRFIVAAGLASRYMLYARTSNDPDKVKRHKHLTAFIVEKGAAGLSVEKINEIMGFAEIQNGVMDLDDVAVPVGNRIGEEGEGWNVMMEGVNLERTLLSAQVVGWMRTLTETVIPYTERRVQFGRRTADLLNNQLKISDLFIRLKMARLACYYSAYLYDSGFDIALEAATSKAFNCERAFEAARDTVQIMGGDGLTHFYMPETIYEVAKVEEISGGTMEAMRLVIHRAGMKQMNKDLTPRRRIVHKDMGVPITTYAKVPKQPCPDEDILLRALADDYKVNPGLYMSRVDLTGIFAIDDKELDKLLESLEQKNLVKLYRNAGTIELAKATYKGLKRAYPLKEYQWFPDWTEEKNRF